MEPSITYSIPYLFVAVLLGVLAVMHYYGNENVKRTTIIASFLLVLVFVGLRGLIMSDWTHYYYFFLDHCSWDQFVNYDDPDLEKFSRTFFLYTLMVKTIFDNYFFFCFVHCLLGLLLLYRYYKRNGINNMPLALMLFLCLEGYVIECNLLRNSIAIFLCMNAMEYVYSRNIWKYMALVGGASLFHAASVLFFPLYFLFRLNLNRWVFITVIAALNLLYLLQISPAMTVLNLFMGGDNIYTLMIQQYTELFTEKIQGITFGYIEKLITCTLVILYFDKLKEVRKDGNTYINVLMMFYVFFFLFAEFGVMARRLSTLFYYAYWVIWYDLIRCFAIENNRRLFCAFVGLFCVVRVASACKYADYEYDNVLTGMKSANERWIIHKRVMDDAEE